MNDQERQSKPKRRIGLRQILRAIIIGIVGFILLSLSPTIILKLEGIDLNRVSASELKHYDTISSPNQVSVTVVAPASQPLSTMPLTNNEAPSIPNGCGPQLLMSENTGQVLCLHIRGLPTNVEGSVQGWNTATGKLEEEQLLPKNPNLFTSNVGVVDTTIGMLFISDRNAVFIGQNHKTFTASLLISHPWPSWPKMLVLPDHSVLVMGGKENNQRTNAVELIKLQPEPQGDTLVAVRLPDLPGAIRTGYGLVALSDGRVMVLGGTDSQYLGCSPCTADTYILDLKTKSWAAGPKMTEPRANSSATLLPDGRVLVAGGWTPSHTWGGPGSRTVEHWDPIKNEFVKNAAFLPTAVAMHRALWAKGEEGKQLLLAGGNSAAVQAYEVSTGVWRIVGESIQGSEKRGVSVASVLIQNRQYLLRQSGESNYSSEKGWNLIPLRMGSGLGIGGAVRNFDSDSGVTLYRSGLTFLPGKNDTPGLALGGSIHAGMNTYGITAAVDAIWPDGHIQALPAFNYARTGAQAFRLADGSILLIGGQVNGQANAGDKVESASSMEWLPGNVALQEARWQPLNEGWAQDKALGQMTDGSLVAVNTSGEVSRIKISTDAQGKPHAEISELPPLHQPRLFQNPTDLIVRGLPDGRIIVAGGEMQNKRLAVMREDSMDPNAADEYLRIGEAESTDDYEIYEPATGQWRQSATSRQIPGVGTMQASASVVPWPQSAASRADGGLLAVYDDGRVARLHVKKKELDTQRSQQEECEMEISSADGKMWSELKAAELPVICTRARMFVLQDELFVAGDHADGHLHTDIQTLQWFNSATRRWETLWQSTPQQNWRDNVGRILIRQLTNGKRVVLPVADML
jgi:hypothetical protein